MKKLKMLLLGLTMALLSMGLFACDLLAITEEDVSVLQEYSTQSWQPIKPTLPSSVDSSSKTESSIAEDSEEDSSTHSTSMEEDSSVDFSSSAEDSSVDFSSSAEDSSVDSSTSAEDSSIDSSTSVEDSSVDSSTSAEDSSIDSSSSAEEDSSVDDSTGVETFSYEITFTAQTGGSLAATYEGGVLASGDTLPEGESVTFTATETEGYTFVGFEVSGTTATTINENVLTLTVQTQAASVTAKFELEKYELTINLNDEEIGCSVGVTDKEGNAVSVFSPVAYGTELTFTALPDTQNGYMFDFWSVEGVTIADNTANTLTFIMPAGNVTVTANFKVSEYEVQFDVGYNMGSMGSVSAKVEEESIPSGTLVKHGTSVTFTATVFEGVSAQCMGWFKKVNEVEEQVSENETYTISYLTEGVDVYAKFKMDSYDITFVCEGNGTISVTVNETTYTESETISVAHGSDVSFKATADDGYTFVGWYDQTDGLYKTETEFIFTANSPLNLKACFKQLFTLSYSVEEGQTDWGEIACDIASGDSVVDGTEVVLTASVENAKKYEFIGWYIGDSSEPESRDVEYTFTISSDTALTAKFKERTYTVTLKQSTGGTIEASDTVVKYEEEVTLTATESIGYEFVEWNIDGITNNKLTVTDDVTVTATFRKISCAVSVSCNDDSMGSVGITATEVEYGDEVTLSYKANSGYTFVEWQISDELKSTLEGNVLTVKDTSVEVKAVFEAIKYVVEFGVGDGGDSVTAIGVDNKSLDTGTERAFGETITFTATAKEGYTFVGWTIDIDGNITTEDSTSPLTMSVPVNGVKVTANFTINIYTVTLEVANGAGGTLTSDGKTSFEVEHGKSILLVATPASGWKVDTWNYVGVGTMDSNNNLTVTDSGTVTVTFTQIVYTITVAADETGYGSVTSNTEINAYYGEENIALEVDYDELRYTFLGWFVGEEESPRSTATTWFYTHDVLEDVSFVAKFEGREYAIEFGVVDNVGGTIEGSFETGTTAKFNESELSLTATVDTSDATRSYEFAGWQINGEVGSNENFMESRFEVWTLGDEYLGGETIKIYAVFTLTQVSVRADADVVAAANRTVSAAIWTVTSDSEHNGVAAPETLDSVTLDGSEVDFSWVNGVLTIASDSVKAVLDKSATKYTSNVFNLETMGTNAAGVTITYTAEVLYADYAIGTADEFNAFLNYYEKFDTRDSLSDSDFKYAVFTDNVDYQGAMTALQYAGTTTNEAAYMFCYLDGRGYTISDISVKNGVFHQYCGKQIDANGDGTADTWVNAVMKNLAVVNVVKSVENGGGMLFNECYDATITDVYVQAKHTVTVYVGAFADIVSSDASNTNKTVISNVVMDNEFTYYRAGGTSALTVGDHVCAFTGCYASGAADVFLDANYNANATVNTSRVTISNCYGVSSTSYAAMYKTDTNSDGVYENVTEGYYAGKEKFAEAVKEVPASFNSKYWTIAARAGTSNTPYEDKATLIFKTSENISNISRTTNKVSS